LSCFRKIGELAVRVAHLQRTIAVCGNLRLAEAGAAAVRAGSSAAIGAYDGWDDQSVEEEDRCSEDE